jgi:hypothetical protein
MGLVFFYSLEGCVEIVGVGVSQELKVTSSKYVLISAWYVIVKPQNNALWINLY